MQGLKLLEYRGYDSAGIAVLEKTDFSKYNTDLKLSLSNKLKIVKEQGKVENLENTSEFHLLNSNIGIAHTRWATHGSPSKINAHPHIDISGTFAVVHNGIIENYNSLKLLLVENGYNFVSQTDTEIISNLINYFFKRIDIENLKDRYLKAISETLKMLKGSYAIEILTPIFPDIIVACKKDSPLIIGKGFGENFIASDIPAIFKNTNEYYFMNDKEIAIITKTDVSFFDADLNKIEKESKVVEMDSVLADKNGYEDFMLKEIFEQPKAIRETIGSKIVEGKDILLDINQDFSKFDKIFIVACGTSMHAGLSSKYSIEHFTKIPVDVDISSEFRYRNPLINEKTLCIFVSQSGETADTIAALKYAKSKNCTTIAIANVLDSSITRIADYTLYTHSGPEIAVASTKAYTCQVVLLNILGLYIAESLISKNSIPKNLEIEILKKQIIDVPKLVDQVLGKSEIIKSFAHRIFNEKDVFFVGRCEDYSVAMEGSLKLKEISYIHSESYPAGELKHGPIALIENNITVVGIATNSIVYSKTISNLEEVQTRGAKIFLITNKSLDNNSVRSILDNNNNSVITIPECNDFLSPIISVIPLQLLAYYISKAKELDVDKPRNLAKSVTVE